MVSHIFPYFLAEGRGVRVPSVPPKKNWGFQSNAEIPISVCGFRFQKQEAAVLKSTAWDIHELRMRRSHSKSRLVTTSSMRRSLRSRFSNLRLTLCSAPTLELE